MIGLNCAAHGCWGYEYSMTRLHPHYVEIIFKPDGFNFEWTGVCLRSGLDSIIVKATCADEPALASLAVVI